MNYKIEGAIRRNRKKFIVAFILWLLLVIVFVVPFSYSKFVAGIEEGDKVTIFFSNFVNAISSPFLTLGKIFTEGAFRDFISTFFGFTIIYAIFFMIGFFRSAPKHEFSDIEHGSSDWSQRGEQYQILSRNKGIILAENNYLPVDKRGNVNVMVVGRFWFW